jgi:hypothetical protein
VQNDAQVPRYLRVLTVRWLSFLRPASPAKVCCSALLALPIFACASQLLRCHLSSPNCLLVFSSCRNCNVCFPHNRCHCLPAIQFGTVLLISRLPPSPLSHKALHAHRATPFRYATTNRRPGQLSFPSHPDQDQHAVCTKSLLHFPPNCPGLRHHSLLPHRANHRRRRSRCCVHSLYTHSHSTTLLPEYTTCRAASQTPLHASNRCCVPSLRALHCIAPASLPAPSPQAIPGLHSLADRIAPSSNPSTS